MRGLKQEVCTDISNEVYRYLESNITVHVYEEVLSVVRDILLCKLFLNIYNGVKNEEL